MVHITEQLSSIQAGLYWDVAKPEEVLQEHTSSALVAERYSVLGSSHPNQLPDTWAKCVCQVLSTVWSTQHISADPFLHITSLAHSYVSRTADPVHLSQLRCLDASLPQEGHCFSTFDVKEREAVIHCFPFSFFPVIIFHKYTIKKTNSEGERNSSSFYRLKCCFLCVTLLPYTSCFRIRERWCSSWISAFVLDQKRNTQAKDNTKHLPQRSLICNLL